MAASGRNNRSSGGRNDRFGEWIQLLLIAALLAAIIFYLVTSP